MDNITKTKSSIISHLHELLDGWKAQVQLSWGDDSQPKNRPVFPFYDHVENRGYIMGIYMPEDDPDYGYVWAGPISDDESPIIPHPTGSAIHDYAQIMLRINDSIDDFLLMAELIFRYVKQGWDV